MIDLTVFDGWMALVVVPGGKCPLVVAEAGLWLIVTSLLCVLVLRCWYWW